MQLKTFTRIFQSDFSYIFIGDFVPLHGTITNSNIFKTVNQTLEKLSIDFSKFNNRNWQRENREKKIENWISWLNKVARFKVSHYTLYYS